MDAICPIQARELPDALRCVLADAKVGRVADARAVRGFEAYLRAGQLAWEGWWTRDARGVTAACIAVLVPGRTAILLSAPPNFGGVTFDAQAACVCHAMNELGRRPLHYVQALVEPAEELAAQLLCTSGFRRLTTLRYLGRDVRFPWTETVPASAGEWTGFADANAPHFRAALRESYRNSQDCPELTGLRPVDDVLASHRASGRFHPEYWQLLRRDGQTCGCLLLTPMAERRLAEITYLGVPADQRGRGYGGLLVRRALEFLRARNFERVSLVVDVRNTVALRLYAAYGFTALTQRSAYIWTPSGSTAPSADPMRESCG